MYMKKKRKKSVPQKMYFSLNSNNEIFQREHDSIWFIKYILMLLKFYWQVFPSEQRYILIKYKYYL